MPLVVLNRNPKKVNDTLTKAIAEALPGLVSLALTIPDNPVEELTSKDIEVWVQDFGKFDINTKDVEIIIWANQHPERKENLLERCKKISDCLKDHIPNGITGFVRVLLQPESFWEF